MKLDRPVERQLRNSKLIFDRPRSTADNRLSVFSPQGIQVCDVHMPKKYFIQMVDYDIDKLL
jgi:hypothetical protein